LGQFEITELDAIRLRRALAELRECDPERANRVMGRTAEHLQTPDHDDKPCPVLDLETGCCDLYASRPITCRVFGAATVDADGNVGACELCYEGATEDQIAGCAVDTDPDGLEADLLEESGLGGMTTIALALAATQEPN
jgi:Fe-S-cluster containining protein